MPILRRHPLALALALALALSPLGCDEPTKREATPPPSPAAEAPVPVAEPSPSPAAQREPAPTVADDVQPASPASPPTAELLALYPWLSDEDTRASAPVPTDTLDRRFAPPPGFTRDDLTPKSFGAFLRTLPLTSAGAPVLSYSGGTILPPDHPNLAAVAAIDIGSRDLQQCADSIVRLHAEWRFSLGKRDLSYRSASGVALPFSRYLKGERIVLVGKQIEWKDRGKARAPNHSALRSYLDGVFAWANTGSLAKQAKKISREDVRPGDFFVMPGGPGHAVLILDLARAEDGRLALLLGQGFMPAQNFQVLRPDPSSPWFIVEPSDDSGVKTPFWETFPWSSLRRLDS